MAERSRRKKKKAQGAAGRASRTAASNDATEDAPSAPLRTGGEDAVCFTAGFCGSSFGAGVVHAYLAADRLPPRVVAGLSMGAVNAAALHECYRVLREEEERSADLDEGQRAAIREAARWRWLQRYVHALTHEPLKVVWDSLPALEDFVSDRPPIHDLATPEPLRRQDAEKTSRRWRQIRFGQWLARSPVSIRHVALLAVRRARCMEAYSWRRVRTLAYWLEWLRTGALLVLHIARHPYFLRERRIHRMIEGRLPIAPFEGLKEILASAAYLSGLRREPTPGPRHGRRLRPLLGWRVYLAALGTVGLSVSALGWGVRLAWPQEWTQAVVSWISGAAAAPEAGAGNAQGPRWFGWLVWASAALFLLPLASLLVQRRRSVSRLLRNLGMEGGLVHDFFIHQRLLELFGPEERRIELETDAGPRLLVVASPLYADSVTRLEQIWAPSGSSLVGALRAALALPPLLGPRCIDGKGPLLVDGSVVRQNPLPALFDFLKRHRGIAYGMCVREEGGARRLRDPAREGDAIHVVHTLPTESRGENSYPDEEDNLVDVLRRGQRLARNRDVHLEVVLTEHLTRVERLVLRTRDVPESPDDLEVLPLTVDDIAPDPGGAGSDENPFRVDRRSTLESIGQGCRKTLQQLYRNEIEAEGGKMACRALLAKVAPRRSEALANGGCPGLSAVCRDCETMLEGPKKATPEEEERRQVEGLTHHDLAPLQGDRPRIVVAASGGVFRGAFHVGLAGALHATRVKPDLIVGASVGSLLGAAIAAMFRSEPERARRRLADLVQAFVHVDETVALTRSLKAAFRDLGNRGRTVRLSPRQVRKMIKRGSRSDPGFAATGAPPVLIDAITDLFLLPRGTTRRIASDFTSGKVTRAVTRFRKGIKEDGLRRLGVERALMGTDLLRPLAAKLLGIGTSAYRTDARQPYLVDPASGLSGQDSVAFFATATDLGGERVVLLGKPKPYPGRPFDFLEAVLASSAFPGIFAPRHESDVFPGSGSAQVRYADGGMFDNLPVVPAFNILSRAQKTFLSQRAGAEVAGLRRRHEHPDLVLVGALNVNPEPTRPEYENALTILKRSKTLGHNVKVRSLEFATGKVHRQVGRMLEGGDDAELRRKLGPDVRELNELVLSAILPIYPADAAHLNGTFAFSRTVGLQERRVLVSIADGCFQTLMAFARGLDREGRGVKGAQTPNAFALEVIGKLQAEGPAGPPRIPDLRYEQRRKSAPHGVCPYYVQLEDGRVTDLGCPFVGGHDEHGRLARRVYERCRKDPVHQLGDPG